MLKLVLQSEYRIIVRHRLSRAVGPNLRAGGGLTLGDLVLFYVRESAPQQAEWGGTCTEEARHILHTVRTVAM